MGLLDSLGALGGIAAAPFTGGTSLIPILAGAAAGAGKHFLVDKPQEEQDKKTAATIMRYSPWTHMAPPPIRRADAFGSILQGSAIGSMFGGLGGGIKPTVTAGEALPLGGSPWPAIRPAERANELLNPVGQVRMTG